MVLEFEFVEGCIELIASHSRGRVTGYTLSKPESAAYDYACALLG